MDPRLSQLDQPYSAKLGLSAADTQLSRPQATPLYPHHASSFRQSFLSAREVQSSIPTTHVNNKSAADVPSRAPLPWVMSSLGLRLLGTGLASAAALHSYTKDSNLFFAALLLLVSLFVGCSTVQGLAAIKQPDDSNRWTLGVDLALLVTGGAMLVCFMAHISPRWIAVAAFPGLLIAGLAVGLAVARSRLHPGLIYRAAVAVWLCTLTLPLLSGSLSSYDRLTDTVYGFLVLIFQTGALLQFVFGFGLVLFLNLRQNGLNKTPKSYLVAAWTILEVVLLFFAAFGASVSRRFGNLVLFWSGKLRPWLEPEEAAWFGVYLVLAGVSLAALAVVSLLYWNEMNNLSLKLQGDIREFRAFWLEMFDGAFGFLAERNRTRALRSRLRDIRQTLQSSAKSPDVCVFCQEHPIDVVFDPCKHATYCHGCFDGIRTIDRHCPRCSKPIKLAVVLAYDQGVGQFRADRILEVKGK